MTTIVNEVKVLAAHIHGLVDALNEAIQKAEDMDLTVKVEEDTMYMFGARVPKYFVTVTQTIEPE